jgi:hypothetical protein
MLTIVGRITGITDKYKCCGYSMCPIILTIAQSIKEATIQ